MSILAIIKCALIYIVKVVSNNFTTANITYLSSSSKLKGKRIVVTGGGRGLGFSMAKRFIRRRLGMVREQNFVCIAILQIALVTQLMNI